MPQDSRWSAATDRSITSLKVKAPPRSAFGVCALLLLVFSGWAQARTVEGRVTHVTDGDTIWVRPADADAALHVRLQGLDAPEICQASGRQSRDALAARLLHQNVELDVRAQDSYARTLARVSFEGHDVGAWLVAEGWAWSSGFRHHAGPYAQEEHAARAARRGLWAQAEPMDPRDFRKRNGSCYPGR
jgi:endonuclease YncB( thermonuclease family)